MTNFKLTEVEQTRLENISLKQQVLLHQKQSLLIMIGTRLGIDISKYTVDAQTGAVAPMVVPTNAATVEVHETTHPTNENKEASQKPTISAPHAETTVVHNK